MRNVHCRNIGKRGFVLSFPFQRLKTYFGALAAGDGSRCMKDDMEELKGENAELEELRGRLWEWKREEALGEG